MQVRVELYFWLADGSSPLRRDVFDLCHELRMPDRVHGTVADFCASRIFAEIVIPVPIMGRTHGPGCEAAATIRANVLEYRFYAIRAECAFVAANPGLR